MPQGGNCCCPNGGCITAAVNEDFASAIPGGWGLSYSGPAPAIVSGGLEKEVNGAGAGMELGPCIAPSVFSGAFTLALETQISSTATAFTTDSDSGITFRAADGFQLRFYRSHYSFDFEELNFSYRLVGGSTVVAYNVGGAFGSTLADGDVLRMEIDGSAEEVDEVRCYFNAALVHTETFSPAETLGDISTTDPLAILELLVSTATSYTERYEYFNVSI